MKKMISAGLFLLMAMVLNTPNVQAQQQQASPQSAMMINDGGMEHNGGAGIGGGVGHSRFSATGVVVFTDATDPKALALNMMVKRASILLQDEIGKSLTLPVRKNVRVGMMGPGYSGFDLGFHEIAPNDVVTLMGYVDNATNEYMVTQIKVRGY